MNLKHVFGFGIVFASIVAFATISAQAQPNGSGPHGNMSPEERIDRRVGFLNEKLDLSETQIESIRGILENAQAEAGAWRKDHSDASREDRQVFRDEHRATTNAAITAVLTEDQQATFKSLQDQRGPHRSGMQGMGHGMGPGMGHGMGHGMKHGMGHGMGHGMNDCMGPGMMGGSRRHHMGRMSMRDSDGDWPAGPMMRGLARKLDLTDKQHQELATMRKDQEARLDAWNDSHPDATWQDRLTFRRDGFDASIEAIGNILTPEQNAKLNELSAKRGKMEFGRRGWDQGPGMFMRQLDLTKDQQEQLETLHEQHRAAAKAWHEANPNATVEQRRAFREAHRKGMEASLEKVLTEDQMAKLKSMRDHHRGGPAWDNPDDAGDEPGEN